MNNSTPAIVLIENDEITKELYERELCKSFTVFAFTELRDVFEVFASHLIRAVIIEPEISSGKGWGLIHTIASTFQDRSIPVIVCSTLDNRNHAPDPEVIMYLTKPVLPRTLREKTLAILQEMDKIERSI